MSRAQVDLINFQTMPDGDFKYIMTYLNHFTKFCILSPLKSKRAEEVASKLLEIFLTFGAPSILQSDNGREFSNAIIAELKTCWPELKLVTGRPRHPQSQGAVERLNGVVQDKLAIWMRENGCKRWSMGLKFVQWQINVSVHETTGQSPFKVTFGEEPRIGLESYVLPKSLVDAAKTEEEIEEFLTSHEANDEDSLNRDGKNYDENESSIMKHLPETFIKARKEAALGQTRAAAKMTRRTKKMLIPLKIGQNCTVRVPDVDRGPADPKNFLVVVMAECEGLYTVGCREGKLASKFTAADLQVISEILLSIDEVPDTEIPLRTALRAAKDMLSACAYLAAHLVDAVAAEKEYYAILVVTPGSHAIIYKPRAIHLTNNHLEGWHNRFNRKAAKSHYGLYELLQILIAEQGVMDTLIQQVLSGNATGGDIRQVNKVYAEKQQRVCPIYG
ncbi:putative integrase core domain protein [Trichinella spiralis]|uniref:putative integrase core domain protein n=1 Tax=Trichinella spiralis TaxID=6334 RepID=UPI0001EFE315|nr:putative integrase core domain protein [Trichinella spiralis]